MKKIRFGIVGCGKIVDCNHIPEILSLGGKAEIVAMFDKKAGKAEDLAAKHKLSPRFCRSLRELLALDLDAVIIATPNCYHYPQTIESLNAGKHVLVEKPMASHVRDADAMINLALRKNLVLQVNQSIRYLPLYAEIKKMVDAGAIGTPIHARCLRAAQASPDVGWSPGATWFVKKRYEGSLITDIAVHMADALQWFFGPIKSIQAITRNRTHEVPDNVLSIFDFKNGATGVMELSWTFPAGYAALELYGEKGALRMLPDGSGFEILPVGEPAKAVLAKDLKPIPNSHACFVEAIAKHEKDAWSIGRGALALCMAIAESSKSARAVAPKNRKSN